MCLTAKGRLHGRAEKLMLCALAFSFFLFFIAVIFLCLGLFLSWHITVGTCCGADFGERSCPKDTELRNENPQLAYHHPPCDMYCVNGCFFYYHGKESKIVFK